MTLKEKVEALRKSLRDEHETTKLLVDSTVMLSPVERAHKLASIDETLAKAEHVFDDMLAANNERQYRLAEVAVRTTVMCWRDLQDACISQVGVA